MKAMLEPSETQLLCVTEDRMSNEENNDNELKLRSLFPTVVKEQSKMKGHENNLLHFFELVEIVNISMLHDPRTD
ncbi:hypothetical protein DPMN_178073 [Dreissena polymorpha]|uniref:Uncharacterized protein n=1 Tax=Dreissena polymorpha TaxID=45954 RepID=A0A9D4EEG5_DREPO|nr:hypothetical protein DPMN_178073 [Dreissena polymorpha]